jgi:hypothetical protein
VSKTIEIPPTDSDDDVENTGDKEKVGRKDQLMVVEMGNYP